MHCGCTRPALQGASQQPSKPSKPIVAVGELVGLAAILARTCPSGCSVRLAPTIANAGIDIGTVRSGYAFAIGADTTVQLQHSWPGELLQHSKATTAIMYARDSDRPVGWGWRAYMG
jgi:hypothetical protein